MFSNHSTLEYHRTSILKADHFLNIFLKNKPSIIDQLDDDRYAKCLPSFINNLYKINWVYSVFFFLIFIIKQKKISNNIFKKNSSINFH